MSLFIAREEAGADETPLSGLFDPASAPPDTSRRRAMIALAAKDPTLAPLFYKVESTGSNRCYPPYDEEPVLPSERQMTIPPEPRRRSVAFINNAYYNFFYLSQELRRRGWDAITVGTHSPNGRSAKFYHGEDLALWAPTQTERAARRREAWAMLRERFGIMHFYGKGVLALFPENYDGIDHDRVPWDVLDAKRRGILIGYSIVGCLDMISQTSFSDWSPGSCARCVWRENADVCSDQRNLAWGWKLSQLADLVSLETDTVADFRLAPNVFRGPLTYAVDPNLWQPNLDIPANLEQPRGPGEILIYHSVGNFSSRTRDGVNMKGTASVLNAIDRLKAEGHPVRLLFIEDVPSIDNRFILAQADIIADQFNYGRYGATAREGMMLGKPVVARINKFEPDGSPAGACIQETPIVSADEDTLYDALRALVVAPELRAELGRLSREHALKWWSPTVLAERFETVYDHLREHGRPPLQ